MLGKQNNVMILHNYGMVRCTGSEMIPQMLMALGAMGGHMGKSGNCCASAYHANAGNAGPVLVKGGSSKMPSVTNPVKNCCRNAQLYQIIRDGGGEYNDVGNCYGTMKAAEKTTLGPIKGIFHMTDATLQTATNQKEGIEAHRAVDFVLSLAQFMTTNARYSDIILPVTTEWERVGGISASNREFVICYSQVTEPLGEAKTDQEIDTLLMEGMGIDADEIFPKSEKQQFFEKIASCSVIGADGKYGPLVTITQADIDDWGVDGTPQEGVVTLQEFIDNGGYQFKRSEGDAYGFIGYEDFVKDPEANPLGSKSGKLEIYCQARYNLLESFDFPNGEAYKPYPTYVVPPIGYESTFKDGKIGGEKGDYPFLMFNPHYLRRSHSVFDNCPWLRETWGNPVFLNRSDAEGLGIAEGDTVLISTPAGKALRKACLMDVLVPGQVGVPHGAWVDVDEETQIDHAGSDNWLIVPDFSGMGVSGYNNLNCNVEKYDGEALEDDCKLPARFVAAE